MLRRDVRVLNACRRLGCETRGIERVACPISAELDTAGAAPGWLLMGRVGSSAPGLSTACFVLDSERWRGVTGVWVMSVCGGGVVPAVTPASRLVETLMETNKINRHPSALDMNAGVDACPLRALIIQAVAVGLSVAAAGARVIPSPVAATHKLHAFGRHAMQLEPWLALPHIVSRLCCCCCCCCSRQSGVTGQGEAREGVMKREGLAGREAVVRSLCFLDRLMPFGSRVSHVRRRCSW